MHKIALTLAAASLIAASSVQIAAAAGHHHGYKVNHSRAPLSEQVRDANDYAAPYGPSDWSRYQNGASSAPAGR